MKRYEKYKPSGIEWIGEVPETWECAKLKYYADVVLGKMLMSKPPQGEEDNYSLEKYLKSKNIGWLEVFASEDDVEEMWFSEYEKSLYLLKDNYLRYKKSRHDVPALECICCFGRKFWIL